MNFEDHSTVGYIDSFLGLFFEKEWASTAVGMYIRGFQLDNTGPIQAYSRFVSNFKSKLVNKSNLTNIDRGRYFSTLCRRALTFSYDSTFTFF